MLSDGLNYAYSGYWWLIYPAGLAIVLTVLSFNFLGDALRHALEVRLRKRWRAGSRQLRERVPGQPRAVAGSRPAGPGR
jgi:hypothetical protein